MEYWEYKADDGLILLADPGRPYYNRSQSIRPSIPTFQYSIIPLTLAPDSRHSQLALTWPRAPGFLRQNKIPNLKHQISNRSQISLVKMTEPCRGSQSTSARFQQDDQVLYCSHFTVVCPHEIECGPTVRVRMRPGRLPCGFAKYPGLFPRRGRPYFGRLFLPGSD